MNFESWLYQWLRGCWLVKILLRMSVAQPLFSSLEIYIAVKSQATQSDGILLLCDFY
ncbi:protein of unknown function [Clostridium beijerinckii]|nr:protein of unknown function [Clostridium beijerinckii]